jgi:hypothetical protein
MTPGREAHPDWCQVKVACNVRGATGAHRSRRCTIDGPLPIEANLYALGATPSVVFVEIHCDDTRLLRVNSAYALGRVLVSMGKACGVTF